MKGACFVGLAALLVAIGCGKGSDRRATPDGRPDGGNATGGKSGGNGGTGGVRPDFDAGDAEATGGGSGTDASTDGGGSGGKGAGGAGAGGTGAGGTGAGGASGTGGQGGTPPKTASTDPTAPVDLAAGDVVQGTLGSADHFWRIPTHAPGQYGLILRSSGNATVGLSTDPNGGLVQPGISGCATGTKGSCGQRIAGSFLTSGAPVTVFVFGPQGTTYELEVVPFTPLAGTPPTTGFSQSFVYETQFTGTVPSGDGPFVKAAPTTELYFWAKTGPATEWFTLPNGFTCAARPYDTYQALKTSATNVTIGTNSYPVNNGTPSFPSKPGAAFASNASLAISASESANTSSGTVTSPTFTGEATASFEDGKLLMEWLGFGADIAFLEFIAETGSTDVQVTCRKDVKDVAPADRKVTALDDEDIKKQIEARNWAIYYWHMAVCTNSPIPEPILAHLFTVPQSVLLLCHALRMTPEQIATKL